MKKAQLITLCLLAVSAVAVVAKPSVETGSDIVQKVRTTAYSYGPKHNGSHPTTNAVGGPLKAGAVKSAAADWSRWPLGTEFKIVETGQRYVVDDIGSAMVGTGTIDLFKPKEADVWRWGVRYVTIEVSKWGSHAKSLEVLRNRTRYRHVREMVSNLRAKIAG